MRRTWKFLDRRKKQTHNSVIKTEGSFNPFFPSASICISFVCQKFLSSRGFKFVALQVSCYLRYYVKSLTILWKFVISFWKYGIDLVVIGGILTPPRRCLFIIATVKYFTARLTSICVQAAKGAAERSTAASRPLALKLTVYCGSGAVLLGIFYMFGWEEIASVSRSDVRRAGACK